MTDVILKPCPFCGSEAKWVEEHDRIGEPYGIVVEHDRECTMGFGMKAEWEHIIAAWNTRADPPTNALREALEPFAFLEMGKTTQEAWEIIYGDRVKDWIDFNDIEAARAALTPVTKDDGSA